MQPKVSAHARQQAQIGIVAVLLMTILLVVALSVSTRVASTVAQETARLESTQTLNQAESLAAAGAGAGGLVDNDNLYLKNDTAVTNSSGASSAKGSVVWLAKGDNIKIAFTSDVAGTNLYWVYNGGTPRDSGCYSEARLMLTNLYPDGSETKSQSYVIVPTGCGRSSTSQIWGRRVSTIDQTIDPNSDKKTYPFVNFIVLDTGDISGIRACSNCELVITALKAGTYIYMDNIASRIRAAAGNQGGSEVRVVEQTETAPAAPVVFNYSLFVGGGKITNQ